MKDQLSKIKKWKTKRAFKRQNRPRYVKVLKHTAWAFLFITPAVILANEGYQIYTNYQKTLEWGHNIENDIKMADLDPAIFQDPNEESVNAKKEFIKLKKEMVKDGLLTDKATNENIEILQNYINIMTSDQEKYQNELPPIKERIEINNKWNSIFEDNNHQVIKKEISPEDVIIIVNETYPFLQNEMIKTYHQDPFSKKILEEQNSVLNDITELNNISYFYKTYIISKTPEALTLPGNMYPKDFTPLQKTNTTYEWKRNETLQKINPLIENQFAENLKDLEKYNIYAQDIQNKETAYENYNIERQKAIDEINYKIWVKEQERLEKIRKEEEEKERKKKEEERKKQEEEELKREKEKITIPDFTTYSLDEIYNWSFDNNVTIKLEPVISENEDENTIKQILSNNKELKPGDKVNKNEHITIIYTIKKESNSQNIES